MYNRLGLNDVAPQWLNLPFAVYMKRATAERDEAFQAEVQDIIANVHGWIVLYELDDQLSRFWGISGTPSVMIIDAHGKVVLPFTLLPYQRVDGQVQPPSGLVKALRAALTAALNGR